MSAATVPFVCTCNEDHCQVSLYLCILDLTHDGGSKMYLDLTEFPSMVLLMCLLLPGTVRIADRNPRNHCSLCKKCYPPTYQHCDVGIIE